MSKRKTNIGLSAHQKTCHVAQTKAGAAVTDKRKNICTIAQKRNGQNKKRKTVDETPAFDHLKQKAAEKKSILDELMKERAELCKEQARLKCMEKAQIEAVHAKFIGPLKDYDQKLSDIWSKISKAEEIFKESKLVVLNPMVEHLIEFVKDKDVLKLIVEYNSFHICPDCHKYMPIASVCQKRAGHYTQACEPMVFAPAMRCPDDFTWKTTEMQELWDSSLAMVMTKATNLGQDIAFPNNYKSTTEHRRREKVWIQISANWQCICIVQGEYRSSALVLFRLTNKLKPRAPRAPKKPKTFIIVESSSSSETEIELLSDNSVLTTDSESTEVD